MLAGLLILVSLAVDAPARGAIPGDLLAMAGFILCQYGAVLAFSPEALHLTIATEASIGEEAVGILSFLMKVTARQAPVIFGVGVMSGLVLVCRAYYLLVWPADQYLIVPDKYFPAREMAWNAAALILCSAILPMVLYLFLMYQLVLEVIRALLACPARWTS